MMRFSRRAALAALPLLAAPAVRAQGAWPNGPVRIVVPFAPGGSTDAVARLAAGGLQTRLGVPIVVENRTGAAGSIGTDAVAKARPDGQSWLLTFDSHATLPALLPNLPFNLTRDLDPVMLIGGAPYVIATQTAKPYRNIQDVLAAARARPDAVSYGSTGNGTNGHLAMILMTDRAGVKMTHLPYRGGGLAVNDAVAGHIDCMIGSAALIAPHIAGGTLRPLVQLGPTRLPGLADTPTVAESGLPALEAVAWWGIFAPTGTPAPVVARFHAALLETFNEPRIRRVMEDTQQASLVLGTPDGLRVFLDEQIAIWGKVVRDNQVRAD
ncbi:tripartite tricarboxylate transporter substrate binding protein [Humitalea sp. 24SJ18S-53]|uniref:tripartite tricarboxylate transporter substrate binding protein n=1 Tax=Humitalea sp. 24SJ18S-53 TaxID=3422307 RepID=UPI003D67FA8B